MAGGIECMRCRSLAAWRDRQRGSPSSGPSFLKFTALYGAPPPHTATASSQAQPPNSQAQAASSRAHTANTQAHRGVQCHLAHIGHQDDGQGGHNLPGSKTGAKALVNKSSMGEEQALWLHACLTLSMRLAWRAENIMTHGPASTPPGLVHHHLATCRHRAECLGVHAAHNNL